MFLPEILLGSITFLSNTFLGFLVYYRNHKSATNKLFLALAYSINVYLIVNYLSLHPPQPTPESQLFWIRVVMFVCSFIGPILVLLVHTFPHEKVRLKRRYILILLCLCLASATLSLSPYLFTSIQYPNGEPVPTPGPGIPVFFVDFVGLFILSFGLLIHKLRKSSGRERTQHFYFLLGIIATFSIMAITTVIFVVILKFSGLVFIGPNATLFLIAFLAYAIVKHRFLDLHFIVARTVAYTLVVGILGGAYTFFVLSVGSRLFLTEVSTYQLLYYVFLTIIVGLSFFPLKRLIQNVTDKIFYKGYYNSQTVLKDLSSIVSSSIQIDLLMNQTLEKIKRDIRIDKGAFIIFTSKNDSKKQEIYIFNQGFEKLDTFSEEKLKKIVIDKKVLIYDDLEEAEIKNLLRELQISLALPLNNNEQTLGVLLLGQKLSGGIYSDEDITMLETFASEAGIAIQNALAFEQIQKFNQTLQAEVNKATENVKSINEDVYKKNFELKRVTDELAAANDKLQALDKLKDEFVSLASHELRTPMTAIKSYLWLFLEYNKAHLDGKEKLYIERAYEATDRLIALVNDMLNVSRIESGRMTIAFKPVNLIQLTKEVMEELSPTAVKQKVELLLDAKDDLPPVRADQNKLREVMINLIGNSLKFTDPGGSVTIRMNQDQGKVVTNVVDTGKGIKEEDLPKLFQKFGIVGNNYLQKQSTQGTGLGLYISKSIIKLHGGDIWVKSDGENKGATFSFSLDINTDQQVEAEQPEKTDGQNAPDATTVPMQA